MEALAIIGLVGWVGYTFKNNTETIRNTDNYADHPNTMPPIEVPNSTNIYSSDKVAAINDDILQMNIDNYNSATDPVMTAILPPIYNSYSLTGDESVLHSQTAAYNMDVDWETLSKISNYNKTVDVTSGPAPELTTRPMFQGINVGKQLGDPEILNYSAYNQPKINNAFSLLTGESLQKEHANMVPFFGSNVKQNVEAFANTARLDSFTGNTSFFKHKQEAIERFTPVQQNIMGTPAFTESVEIDRYIPSKYHQGEKIAYEQQVSAPKAFTYNNPVTLAQISQPTIDQFRIGNRTQVSYTPQTNSGQMGSVRGVMPIASKNKVSTDFELGKSRWFTSTGSVVAKQSDMNYDNIQSTVRQNQNIEYYGGSGVSSQQNQTPTINRDGVECFNNVKGTVRQQLRSDAVRGIGSNIPAVNDFGKKAYNILNQERDTTSKMHTLNINRAGTAITNSYTDFARSTGKEIINNKPSIRTNSTPVQKLGDTTALNAGLIGNNIKTTQKESLVHNNYNGTVQEKNKSVRVGNYNLKTTNKETTTTSYSGGLGPAASAGASTNIDQYLNANVSDTKEQAVSGQRPGNGTLSANGGIAGGQNVIGRVSTRANTLFKELDTGRLGPSGNIRQSIRGVNQIGESDEFNGNSEIENTRLRSKGNDGQLFNQQLENNPFYNIKRTFA